MKEICPSKVRTTKKSKPAKSNSEKPVRSENVSKGKDEVQKMDEPNLPLLLETSGEFPITDSPATPVVRIGTTLLEAKKRKRNRSTAKKPAEPENSSIPTNAEKSISMSSKRRKKSWTTLKEIADSSEQGKKNDISNLPIPFLL